MEVGQRKERGPRIIQEREGHILRVIQQRRRASMGSRGVKYCSGEVWKGGGVVVAKGHSER